MHCPDCHKTDMSGWYTPQGITWQCYECGLVWGSGTNIGKGSASVVVWDYEGELERVINELSNAANWVIMKDEDPKKPEPTKEFRCAACGHWPIENAGYCKACWDLHEAIWPSPYWRKAHDEWEREQHKKKRMMED